VATRTPNPPPFAKPVSIKDIARIAGVTHSTVSRALRNSPLVNRETVEKIQRIARESGYRTSAAARSLVTRRSDTIGVVATSIADPFVAGVVSGIEETADQHGLSVFLANSNAEPDREVRVAQKFQERRVDGIIVTASRVGAQYLPLLTGMQVPIVLLNNQHPSQFAHSVMIANVQASLEATRHLISLGHRRIAYLGDRSGYQSDAERFAGYCQGLQGGGLPFEPQLVVHGDGKPEGAQIPMAELLALPQPPTAVFCYNDMSALGAMRQIRQQGLRIPDDISLVGFDDLYISQYLDPPLTTVRQPMRHMGRMAMETLLKIFGGADSGHDIRVPGELIVRQSTAPPKEK
jgi:DNA-binding LacI/PurR family transcriptional regulator